LEMSNRFNNVSEKKNDAQDLKDLSVQNHLRSYLLL